MGTQTADHWVRTSAAARGPCGAVVRGSRMEPAGHSSPAAPLRTAGHIVHRAPSSNQVTQLLVLGPKGHEPDPTSTGCSHNAQELGAGGARRADVRRFTEKWGLSASQSHTQLRRCWRGRAACVSAESRCRCCFIPPPGPDIGLVFSDVRFLIQIGRADRALFLYLCCSGLRFQAHMVGSRLGACCCCWCG